MKIRNLSSIGLAVYFILIWISIPAAHAQVNILINILNTSTPFVSEWKQNPATGSITVMNQSGQEMWVRFEVSIEHTKYRRFFKGTVDNYELSPGSHQYNCHNIFNLDWKDEQWDTRAEDIIFRTGRMPEGKYKIQISVSEGRKKIAKENDEFEIVYPDPPTLMEPADATTVYLTHPIFLWTPAIMPPEFNVFYKLTIVPLLKRQKPKRALQSNIPLLETTTEETMLPYPMDGMPFEENQWYAWQIQALDENNYHIANNKGYSEIFTFTYAGQPDIPVEPTIIRTETLTMQGLQEEQLMTRTETLTMHGLQTVSGQTRANPLVMKGLWIKDSNRIRTTTLTMAGVHHTILPDKIITRDLTMKGVQDTIIINPYTTTAEPLMMKGLRSQQ